MVFLDPIINAVQTLKGLGMSGDIYQDVPLEVLFDSWKFIALSPP